MSQTNKMHIKTFTKNLYKLEKKRRIKLKTNNITGFRRSCSTSYKPTRPVLLYHQSFQKHSHTDAFDLNDKLDDQNRKLKHFFNAFKYLNDILMLLLM